MKDKEIKTVKKSFRFTKSEWLEVERKCKFSNITSTQYFQKISLTGKTAKRDCMKERKMYLGQIGRFSNNLNQVARQLNSSSEIEFWMLQLLVKIESHLNKDLLL